LLLGRPRGRQGIGSRTGIARIERFDPEWQQHCKEYGDKGKRPRAGFHRLAPLFSSPWVEKNISACFNLWPLALLSIAA
jgi:hypothetical protein